MACAFRLYQIATFAPAPANASATAYTQRMIVSVGNSQISYGV